MFEQSCFVFSAKLSCWVTIVLLSGCLSSSNEDLSGVNANNGGASQHTNSASGTGSPPRPPDDPQAITKIEDMYGEVFKASDGIVNFVDFGGAFGERRRRPRRCLRQCARLLNGANLRGTSLRYTDQSLSRPNTRSINDI